MSKTDSNGLCGQDQNAKTDQTDRRGCGCTFPLPAPAHTVLVSREESCPFPAPCLCRDFAGRAPFCCPLDLDLGGGLEEAVWGFAGGDDFGRASSIALLLGLVSSAFCRGATLARASLLFRRAVGADTTGREEAVRSIKSSRST